MDRYGAIKERFPGYFGEKILASSFSSYRAGGIVDLVVRPQNSSQAAWLIGYCSREGIECFVAGNASNILVSDKGFPGVFLFTGRMKKLSVSGNLIEAESGRWWDDLVAESVHRGLAGLEKTSHIPGSVGGAVYMNAGAFGQEVFDRLISLRALDKKTLKTREIRKEEIRYSYRKVEGIEKYLILSAKFSLEKGDKGELLRTREEIITKRKEKQPLDYPSAGSVFKRPPGDYASRLIDSCGLKGRRKGGAMVSEKHAGFIINYDNASASDIRALMLEVAEEVLEKTGVKLELEQILVGDFEE